MSLHGGSVIASGHKSHLGGTWIRTQQRIITAVFPHANNRKYLIPNRGKDLATGESVPGATTGTPP